jgi:hypothetical protein
MKNQNINLIVRAAVSLLLIGCWIAIFVKGSLIDSKPLREAFALCQTWDLFWNIIVTWTPTNIALLSISSGWMGGLCRGLFDKEDDAENTFFNDVRHGWTGLIAGFVVYIAFLAGILIASADIFNNPTPGQYNQLAGFLSITAFVGGMKPSFLEFLFGKVQEPKPEK